MRHKAENKPKIWGVTVCVQGKQHKIKFSSSNYRAKKPLEYIHSDLWGASRTPTQGGNLYFLSIVDDYSRKVWVYLLKNKLEAHNNIKIKQSWIYNTIINLT